MAGKQLVKRTMRLTDSRSCTPVAERVYAEAKRRGGHYFAGAKAQLTHIGYGYMSRRDV